MEELKNKFIEAMRSIDFGKLTIYELKNVAESNYEKPKTIGEMRGE